MFTKMKIIRFNYFNTSILIGKRITRDIFELSEKACRPGFGHRPLFQVPAFFHRNRTNFADIFHTDKLLTMTLVILSATVRQNKSPVKVL